MHVQEQIRLSDLYPQPERQWHDADQQLDEDPSGIGVLRGIIAAAAVGAALWAILIAAVWRLLESIG